MVTEKGPATGQQHKGRDIPAWIVTDDGARLVYDRTAAQDRHGRITLAHLKRGERVIAPGLIYRPA